ncbi:Gfo/Idh/MocA family protein [Phaeobacter sp. C3_T13_0]|uniref:Gfo/Idh/MocA family protein n=1 Tax=Phaeobacter cretensis TaxID=3342641 RepID=UPI0039BC8DCB
MTRVLIAGLGNMGFAHAVAHHQDDNAQIVGLVNRSGRPAQAPLQDYPVYNDFQQALTDTTPDLVVIATYSDSHAAYAIAAMEAGAHVFVEKPLATTVADAHAVTDTARRLSRKLMVGYILRHHPSWQRLIAEARDLGPPYVFRMNLNQQSAGATWDTHKALMQTTSPIVDCGVHYVDVMCQITDATPQRVHGIGLRLSDEIAADMYNYGQFQVTFSDGSVGWYEAGWGPMMSETAYFVKDVISPNGSVSITETDKSGSDDVDGHTSVGSIIVHRATQDHDDRHIDLPDEPGHQALCSAEQAHMLRAISEDLDMDRHMQDAVASLAICLAADQSIRSGTPVDICIEQHRDQTEAVATSTTLPTNPKI